LASFNLKIIKRREIEEIDKRAIEITEEAI
jgi:hypothetical protein